VGADDDDADDDSSSLSVDDEMEVSDEVAAARISSDDRVVLLSRACEDGGVAVGEHMIKGCERITILLRWNFFPK
jgi:hypothetical protein